MGADAAKAIQDLLASVNKPAKGIFATLVGIALLVSARPPSSASCRTRSTASGARRARGRRPLVAAARAPALVRDDPRPRLPAHGLARPRRAISALGKWWGPAFGGWETLLQIVNLLVGFGLTTLVFAMIYKLMPRVKVEWHDVWLGALVTSLLFTIGKFLIGLYIGKSGVASGFGAAGSLIVVFIWVYYSAQIFLLGAEFTWVYAKTLGSLRSEEGVAEVAQKAGGTDEVPARSAEPQAAVERRCRDRLACSAPEPGAQRGGRDARRRRRRRRLLLRLALS
jgi:membrane protein